MFDPQTPAETAPPDPSRERTERHLRVLQELAEIGMDLARLVRGQAQAAAPETNTPDLCLSFSRIARAVRQTVVLEARLDEDDRARQQRLAAERRAEAARLVAETRRRGGSRKLQAVQIVERAFDLDGEPEEGGDAEAFGNELCEWLFDSRDDADFADRPIEEILAQICRDLRLDLDRVLTAAGEPPIVTSPPDQVRGRRAASPRSRGEETKVGDTQIPISSPTQVGEVASRAMQASDDGGAFAQALRPGSPTFRQAEASGGGP